MDEATQAAIAAGRGDEAVLTRLVRLTQGEVSRLCAHLVDREEADDLTHPGARVARRRGGGRVRLSRRYHPIPCRPSP